jgi:hypothetical protein
MLVLFFSYYAQKKSEVLDARCPIFLIPLEQKRV